MVGAGSALSRLCHMVPVSLSHSMLKDAEEARPTLWACRWNLYLASVVKSSKVSPHFWPPSSYFHRRHLISDRLQAFLTMG
jgi:hypothetical protein